MFSKVLDASDANQSALTKHQYFALLAIEECFLQNREEIKVASLGRF